MDCRGSFRHTLSPSRPSAAEAEDREPDPTNRLSSSSSSLPKEYELLLRMASTMETPLAEDVIAFLTARGFSAAAAALRDDLLSCRPADGAGDINLDLDVGSALPQLRLSPPFHSGHNAPSSPASGSSAAFVSLCSSPSELLNPYGVWSPAQTRSDEESTEGYSEFGTARAYNSYWYDDQHGGPFLARNDFDQLHSEDKFIMCTDGKEQFSKQETLRNEFRQLRSEGCDETCCSFIICDCCNGSNMHEKREIADMVRSSSSVIYGRYQILDDQTERLDEWGDYELQFKRVHKQPDIIVLENEPDPDNNRIKETGCSESDLADKDLWMLDNNAVDTINSTNHVPTYNKDLNGESSNGKIIFVNNMEDEEPEKEYSMQPFEEEVSKQGAHYTYDTDDTDDELHLCNSQADELEVFDLRIIHRRNRTGFEENKEFPIILRSVAAGRYYIKEYLGSAAFSKVVRAHDLHTGMDVCLKIINNDKNFFDQSLDEIKLLKYVNKHDPTDKHHILRLYDYFYHQEHLFIVTELLRANLYEFQKYNHESGGEEYYTLPRIQAIARQCLEALRYLHHLRIIHADLKPENVLIKSYSRCEIKVIDLGSSCFETDNLCLYVQSRSYRAPEVILGLPYDQKIDIWSLGCILAELHTGDVLFPNDSVALILARMIGILGPIDEEMIAQGQETSKYFTENYDLYHSNQETEQIEYLIPERSLLSHQLQNSDAKFIDFLSQLLQINPAKRPTASEALEHEWLFISYH